MAKIDSNKFITNEHGTALTTFVESFVVGELYNVSESVICFRLYDSIEDQSAEVAADRFYQFRMSPKRARALAEILLEVADELDGVGHTHQ
ncbi:MAG: hypothetical protein ABJL99_09840 [Aliishimia sp.]